MPKKNEKSEVEEVETEVATEVIEGELGEDEVAEPEFEESDAELFRFETYDETIKVLARIQEAPDNAVVRYCVSELAPKEAFTGVLIDGVAVINPRHVNSFISQAPSFTYVHVDLDLGQ